MADLEELMRVVEREVPSRELKKLEEAVKVIADRIEPQERVLGAANGVWFNGKRCLAVATSRQVAVADQDRLELLPYARLVDVEYSESWRKSRLVLRAQGSIADIRDIHLDRGRQLHSIIQTARSTSALG